MAGIPSPFSGQGSDTRSADGFDAYDSFVPGGVPDPGPFLEDHDVLDGPEHATFHRLSKRLFEDRGVYDVTFGYNLARLNLDRRHPGAGYRYAVESGEAQSTHDGGHDDRLVLRAEFTPTTPFCPQSESLTVGSFRAWNGEADRHEYDLVRVRVNPMHHRSESINEELSSLEPESAGTAEVVLDGDGSDDSHTELLRDRLEMRDGEESTAGSASADRGQTDGVDRSTPF